MVKDKLLILDANIGLFRALSSVLLNLVSYIPEIKIMVDARAVGRVKNILE
jgi:hypothetical protein|tara:strand:+ start:24 stop:176 length:153 start_codon:yes stop_codon:yes gene_type:complete